MCIRREVGIFAGILTHISIDVWVKYFGSIGRNRRTKQGMYCRRKDYLRKNHRYTEENEIEQLRKKIEEGLRKSERKMLLEKALRGENDVISKDGGIKILSAKDVLRERFGL